MIESEVGLLPAIDIVCNLFTPEVARSRPSWSRRFLDRVFSADGGRIDGLSVEEHVTSLTRGGVQLAFLVAAKMGVEGPVGNWRLSVTDVLSAVDQFPDRFRAIVGIDPFEGMRGVRELETLVRDHGVIGAHIYPHWFDLPPNDPRYYPYYSKCAELGIPVQIQVGHCLRYNDERPLRSVGRPMCLDDIACILPELKIVGIHAGWPWTEEMISVAFKHTNVFIGIDAYAPSHLDASLVTFMDSWGSDKVMFGTDFPVLTHERVREEFDRLPIRPESRRRILFDNAARVYGI